MFANIAEVHLAFAQGKVATHTKIKLRMAAGEASQGETPRKHIVPVNWSPTNVGRRDVQTTSLPPSMSYYYTSPCETVTWPA